MQTNDDTFTFVFLGRAWNQQAPKQLISEAYVRTRIESNYKDIAINIKTPDDDRTDISDHIEHCLDFVIALMDEFKSIISVSNLHEDYESQRLMWKKVVQNWESLHEHFKMNERVNQQHDKIHTLLDHKYHMIKDHIEKMREEEIIEDLRKNNEGQFGPRVSKYIKK